MLRFFYLFALVLLAGCATTDEKASAKQSDFNLLGIVKVENDSYAPTGAAQPSISEGEILTNTNPTGRKIELLWGLLTFTDY